MALDESSKFIAGLDDPHITDMSLVTDGIDYILTINGETCTCRWVEIEAPLDWEMNTKTYGWQITPTPSAEFSLQMRHFLPRKED